MKRFNERMEFDSTFKSFKSIELDNSDEKEVFTKLLHSIDKRKRKNKFFRWSNNLLSAAIITILIIGGGYFLTDEIISEQASNSTQNENIQAIKSVLEYTFTGPDQKLIDLLENPSGTTIIGEEKISTTPERLSELEVYLEEKYKSYFTENMYEKYVKSYALNYQLSAHRGNYQLSVERIDVHPNESTEGAYEFTVNVLYQKEDSGQKTAKVSGRAHIYEKGKISNIDFVNDGGLSKALKE